MAYILLVEDDQDQCREYSIYLRSQNGGLHIVDEAMSATEAVRLAIKNKYDLVLLDIMMAYQEEDEKNNDIIDHEVDYGRKMGLYIYKQLASQSSPPKIALVSVVRDLSILSEFPQIIGNLPKYFSLKELGIHVNRWLSVK